METTEFVLPYKQPQPPEKKIDNIKDLSKELDAIAKDVQGQTDTLKEIVAAVKGQTDTLKEIVDAVKSGGVGTAAVLSNEKCSVLMACRIAQIIAAVLFIVSVTSIYDNPCQLKIALQNISLENFPDSCKNNVMTKTPVSIALGTFMLFLNIISLICLPCLCWKDKPTTMTIIKTLLLAFCSIFTIITVVLSSSLLVYEEGEQKNINYVDLQTAMLSHLETHYTSDEIDSGDAISNKWNRFFIQYDCCAVREVQGTTNDFDNTKWCTTSGSCQATSSQIPKTCCKDVTFTNYQSAASNCHASVNPGTFKSSCISRMKELSIDNVQGYQVTMVFLLTLFIVTVQVADLFLIFKLVNNNFFKE